MECGGTHQQLNIRTHQPHHPLTLFCVFLATVDGSIINVFPPTLVRSVDTPFAGALPTVLEPGAVRSWVWFAGPISVSVGS